MSLCKKQTFALFQFIRGSIILSDFSDPRLLTRMQQAAIKADDVGIWETR